MKTMLIIESAKGREQLFRSVEETLIDGEAIVKITDTISVDSTVLTVPADPNAEIVAREPPKLLPGGVTALISYVRVRGAPFRGLEYRMERTQVVSTRDIQLKAERVGKTPKSASA
ncbi:MAG: hypothetical protein ACYDDF_09220 [Thermoplasmatota archaeon]